MYDKTTTQYNALVMLVYFPSHFDDENDRCPKTIKRVKLLNCIRNKDGNPIFFLSHTTNRNIKYSYIVVLACFLEKILF